MSFLGEIKAGRKLLENRTRLTVLILQVALKVIVKFQCPAYSNNSCRYEKHSQMSTILFKTPSMYTMSSVYCRIHHIVTTMAKKLLLKTRTPVLQAIKGQREQFPHNTSLCDKVQHGTKATFVTPKKEISSLE